MNICRRSRPGLIILRRGPDAHRSGVAACVVRPQRLAMGLMTPPPRTGTSRSWRRIVRKRRNGAQVFVHCAQVRVRHLPYVGQGMTWRMRPEPSGFLPVRNTCLNSSKLRQLDRNVAGAVLQIAERPPVAKICALPAVLGLSSI